MKTIKAAPPRALKRPDPRRKCDRLKLGIEIQTYGLDANKTLIHAGPHFVPEVTPRWLFKLHRHWCRWRRWYSALPENQDHTPHTVRIAYFEAHYPDFTGYTRITIR